MKIVERMRIKISGASIRRVMNEYPIEGTVKKEFHTRWITITVLRSNALVLKTISKQKCVRFYCIGDFFLIGLNL